MTKPDINTQPEMNNRPNTATEIDAEALDQVVGGGRSTIVVHDARNQELGDKLGGGTDSARTIVVHE